MPSKVLFLSSPHPDYCSVALLHGLRTLLGANVVDWPKYECAYNDFEFKKRNEVYGMGFTLFFNLSSIEVNRLDIEQKVVSGFFDLIIFSDIWNQTEIFKKYFQYLNPRSTILIDGQDTQQVVPHAGKWWRRPVDWISLTGTNQFLYFKREWSSRSRFNLWHRFLPSPALDFLPISDLLRPIGFSIPESKIIAKITYKTKDFPLHIVDTEVAKAVSGSADSYQFSNEGQSSKFGITMKRSGWDGLRHYEIAANGAVPCFRGLKNKPITSAPHGLIPGVNCLEYNDVRELMSKTSCLSDEEYNHLQMGALDWAKSNSTTEKAREFLQVLNSEGIKI